MLRAIWPSKLPRQMALVVLHCRRYDLELDHPLRFTDSHIFCEYPLDPKMNRTLNIILITGIVLSVAVAFILSVKTAGTTSAAISKREIVVSTSQPMSVVEPPDPFHLSGIPRLVQLETNLQNTTSDKITKYTVKS